MAAAQAAADAVNAAGPYVYALIMGAPPDRLLVGSWRGKG